MYQELTYGIAIAVLVFFFLCVWLLYFLLYYQRKKRDFIENKQRMEANYKMELTRVEQEIQEETIKQIGYELHDNIGQLVTVAKIHLQNILKDGEEPRLKEIHIVVSKALEELRRLSKSLDTSSVEKMSLEELLTKDQTRINQLGHINFQFKQEGDLVEIDSKKKIILYRMMQEIVTNALKHAKCDEINVNIHYGPEQFIFIVADNGRGFNIDVMNSTEHNGSGLIHLKSRANLLGGQLILNSSRETGTKYEIICPKSSLCLTK
jgi:signal transduction histidine kinase